MEALLEKFTGKIDTNLVIARVAEIKRKYIDDGLTKADIPPILVILMTEVNKFKKLKGEDKRELVIGILNHLIEQIDRGEEDSEFETVLKTMVPSMVDSFSVMLKLNKVFCCFK
jgi:hypothetical protein